MTERDLLSSQRKACLPCRKRKLRCNREQPCTNCISRSLDCSQQILAPPNRGVKRSFDEADELVLTRILSRLDRIEGCIDTSLNINNTNHASNSNQAVTTISNKFKATRQVVLGVAQNTPESIADRLTQSDLEYDTVFEFSVNDNILSRALMYDLCIFVSKNPLEEPSPITRNVQLPPKSETQRLINVYFNYFGQLQCFIYEPHARILIEEAYNQVTSSSQKIAPRGCALILALLAAGSLLEPLQGSLDEILPVIKQRLGRCTVYIRASMDCLEQQRRRLSHTIEDVQALLVLQFLIHHIEARSLRYRSLMAEAITIAQSLRIHLLDSRSSRDNLSLQHSNPENSMRREIKRRIWWYLAATDWLVSMIENSVEIAHHIDPNFVHTHMPKHINDNDLGEVDIQERPLSEPTTMSYFLQRVKIAQLARSISTAIPHDPRTATCEIIFSLDSQLEMALQQFPSFFRSEVADSESIKRIDQAHSYIPMQRFLVNMMLNLIRCKLHFPYLVGSPDKALHAYSRQMSLKAARRVLLLHNQMTTSNIAHSADFLKIQGTSFQFMGALILATDLCCNRSLCEDPERQVMELMGILDQLEGMKRNSQIAGQFLEKIKKLLAEKGLWSGDAGGLTMRDGREFEGEILVPDDAELGVLDSDIPFPFDDLWESFIDRPSALDMIDLM